MKASAKPSGKFTRTSFEVGDRVEITAPDKKYDGAIARILAIFPDELLAFAVVGFMLHGRSYSLRISTRLLVKTDKLSPNELGEVPHQITPDGQATIFVEDGLPEYNEAYSVLEELAQIRIDETAAIAQELRLLEGRGLKKAFTLRNRLFKEIQTEFLLLSQRLQIKDSRYGYGRCEVGVLCIKFNISFYTCCEFLRRLNVICQESARILCDRRKFKEKAILEKSRKKLDELEKEICNSHQHISSPVVEETPREQLTPDIAPSGELKAISTPPPSGEIDSPHLPSTNPISEICQIALFNPSEYQKSLSEVVLAPIFQLQEVAPDLKEIAETCFLSTSDSFDSSSLQFLSGKMLMQSFRRKTGKTSPKSSRILQRWGMWGHGRCGMEIGMSPKTENGFSWWVFSGDVRATIPNPQKKLLSEILEGEAVNSATGESIDQASTIRENSFKQGVGSRSNPNTFVKVSQDRDSLAVVYHAADGDRDYSQEAPTLRGLSGDGGAGAYQVREGERLRTIKPEEAEGLMGWEIGSTALGIDGEGNRIAISNTNRIAACGNGIIPAEVTEILTAIKPFLENKLEQEIPQNLRLAYKQLRKNKTHLEAKEILGL